MKTNILLFTLCIFCMTMQSLKAENGIEQENKTPSRIEKKSFSGISQVSFTHMHGNVVVRESTTNKVDLEIQYFDRGKNQATCNVTESNKTLSVNTTKSLSKSVYINYIITLPKNTKLDININYGNINIDKHQGTLNTNMQYSDMKAQSIVGDANIVIKYGDIKIDNCKNINLKSSYSDVKIRNTNSANIQADYGDFKIEAAQSVNLIAMYGDFKIGTVESLTLSLKHTDIIIGSLVSGVTAAGNYSDIRIDGVSPKLKNINIDSNYGDISIALIPEISASFDINIGFGDLDISNSYSVKYTQQENARNKIIKKGQIGTKTPTAKLTLSSNYADITIK